MSRQRVDRALVLVLGFASMVAAALVLLVLIFLGLESLPALRSIGTRFATDPSWHPTPLAEPGTFDILPMVLGTLATSLAALGLAVPLGVVSGTFCHFVAPPGVGHAYRRLIELLAGIPSVVYGFWALTTLVPLIRSIRPPGQSLLAAALVLTLMILPTIALLTDAAFRAIPRTQLEAATALGLSRWATLRSVAFPLARPGILTGILLAGARAVGETMAVLMVAGNVVQNPSGLFAPIRTLTANIALEMGYAAQLHRSALFVSGIVLMLGVGALFFMTPTAGRRWS